MTSLHQSVNRLSILLLLIFTTFIFGCGSFNLSESSNDGGNVKIKIEGTPSVNYNEATGKTTVVVQFITRDENDLPLESSRINVGMEVDNKALDNESLLEESAKELEVNLLYSMVLDASYSMTQHNPPAFEPMKQAAKNSLDEVNTIWSSRLGKADFFILWFNEYLYRNIGPWSSNNILLIPTPEKATATKLFAAVDYMASDMAQAFQNGIAAGSRDRHIMIVLSDGADNFSFFTHVPEVNETLSLQGGAQYRKLSWPGTARKNALDRIKAHPNLTVHVIGLGSDVNDTELTDIARAGNGVYLKNPSATELNSLFSRVTREFTTIQTRGASIPLPPGDYTFKLVVKNLQNNKSDNYSFRFHTGDANAGVIP